MSERTVQVTPAQERAAEALWQLHLVFSGNRDTEYEAKVALGVALDEAEMVEAIRNAPCIVAPAIYKTCGTHPECAARAVLDLILGEKEKPTTKPTWAEAWEELGPLVLPTPIYPDPEVKP